MKIIKKYLLLFIFISITGFGAALSLKAAIGVGPWDALAQSISFLTPFKIGTVGIMLNSGCILVQLMILKRDFTLKILLQIVVAFITGSMINLFYYNVLGSLVINSYILSIILLLISNIIIAFCVSCIMELDIVNFPLEGFCVTVSDRFNLRFTHLRQLADVLSIVLILLITFVFSVPVTLREGTIISMLVFSPLLHVFMPKIKPMIEKLTL